MYLKRSTALGLLGALLLSGACTASQEAGGDETAQSESKPEMVEMKVRLADGRVITRMVRRFPARLRSDHPLSTGRRPAILNEGGQNNQPKVNGGTVRGIEGGASGGSNSNSGMSGGSGSGSGGSSSGGQAGGGGGAGSRTGTGGESVVSAGEADTSWAFEVPDSVLPDDDYRVRIYSWANSGNEFEHVLEAYLADPRGNTPQMLASKIAVAVASDRPEKIAIRFWKELIPATRDPFDFSSPRELLNAGGYKDGLTEYWRSFAVELERLGVEPDYLIFDQEKGIGFWHIEASQRQEFFQAIMSPVVPLEVTLPESMASVTVEQLMNYRNQQGTVALNAYSQFAARFRANFLNDVFSDAFESAYGRYIPVSNYKDVDLSFGAFSYTGRPLNQATVGGVSAPVSYLDYQPNGVRYSRLRKDQRWNRLIDILNGNRSASAIGLVTPWISAPGYGAYGPNTWARPNELSGEYQIWEIMMDHFLAMGIDTFILWNPQVRFNRNAVATDAFVDNWLEEHPACAGPQLADLPEIPLDADQITTNGVVTTYEDFMAAMNNQ